MAVMARPAWFQRFWKDLTTKEFSAIKVLFFLIYGASMAMFPFLTLQARSLGITEQELGVVYAFNPVIAILGPPITGIIADKIGNFKLFLSVTMAASGCAALVFSAVPIAREHYPMPSNLPYTVTCGGSHPGLEAPGLSPDVPLHPQLSLDSPYRCDLLPDLEILTLNITKCSLCSAISSEADEAEGPCADGDKDSPTCQALRLLEEVPPQLTARALSNDENVTLLEVTDWLCPDIGQAGIQLDLANEDVAEDVTYSVAVSELASSSEAAATCSVTCSANVAREKVCSNTRTTIVHDPMLTFWCYFLVRILNGLTLATSFTLFDGAAMAILKEHDGDYGLQRLYGNLGAIVVTPISGVLIDVFSKISNTQDYRPAFYLYCGFKIVAAVVILFVSLDFRQPSNRVLKDFRALIKMPEILAFLLVMLISGSCFGLLDTFLFWLLQDLGATKFLMGITITVGSISGIPILIASGAIFKKLGPANTIILGFAFYVIRMMGYSYLTSPWWCMPFECLECFTVSLMGAAAVSYAAELATPSTLATLQGVYGGIHYGVGRGMGSLIGGFLIAPLGVRNTFRLMAGVCAVTCIVYFIVNYIFFRKQQMERMEAKKKEKQEKKRGEEENTKEKTLNGNIESGIIPSCKENESKSDTKENVSLETVKENGFVKGSSSKEVHNPAYVEEE